MRYVAHVAAVIGLLALGLALGDFASNPNVGGGVAIVVMLAVLIFALGQLYRPGGVASREPAPRAPRERRPSKAAPPAEEPAPQPRRRERPSRGGSDGVWAGGWDAKEADEARERRREERARRKGRG